MVLSLFPNPNEKRKTAPNILANISCSRLLKKTTGKYYTSHNLAQKIAVEVANAFHRATSYEHITILDPFCGDGRLILPLVKELVAKNTTYTFDVELWDVSPQLSQEIESELLALNCNISVITCDSFEHSLSKNSDYNIIVTNPPWEVLKPDKRELEALSPEENSFYIRQLKEYDTYLAQHFPLSQPKRKFAGWGTNLSRVGLELCLRLCKENGTIGIILPSSTMADIQSGKIRKKIFENFSVQDICFYPAELRLFEHADVTACSVIMKKGSPTIDVKLSSAITSELNTSSEDIQISQKFFLENEYIIPMTVTAKCLKIVQRLDIHFSKFEVLEKEGLWAGREVDETNLSQYLNSTGEGLPFLKGRMIDRFMQKEPTSFWYSKKDWKPPVSTNFSRIVWRDVSRPNQKRRMITTQINDNSVAGNSLGVAYFRDGNKQALLALLGVMSSVVFEIMLRCFLSTGHVSLSSLRKVAVPTKQELLLHNELSSLVNDAVNGKVSVDKSIEGYVASRVYKLSKEEFQIILDHFPKLSQNEHNEILSEFLKYNKDVPTIKNVI